MGVARRLVEHYPVGDELGVPPPRPRTPDELIVYVEWALPRARKLGTRVTVAEQRAIGFMHGARQVRLEAEKEAAAALERQRQAAADDRDAAAVIVTE